MNKGRMQIGGPSINGQYSYFYAGEACSPADAAIPDDEPDDCLVTLSGTDICLGRNTDPEQEKLCGTIDGNSVCFDTDVPPENCLTFQDGSKLCAGDAPTPPRPDNGTPGVPAEPDDELEVTDDSTGSTKEQDYYNPDTVGGSTGRPPDAAAGEGDGTEGVGACDPMTQNCCQGDECDDVLTGGLTCSTPPSCSGSPIQCYHSRKLWIIRCSLDRPSDGDIENATSAPIGNPSPGSLIPEVESIELDSYFSPESASTECPDDLSFTLIGDLGGTYIIPVSQWCSLLYTIGILALMAAGLASARIFIGGL